MNKPRHIVPPTDETDTNGALRVFDDFFSLYQPTLVRAEAYLEDIIEKVEPIYGEAYRPWHRALKDLMRGVYLMTRKIPLTNKESFLEALKIFSLESAIQFLKDICIS